MTDRTCSDCQKPISVKSKGRCRSCCMKARHADPVWKARHTAALKAAAAAPEARARRSETARKRFADPAERAAMSAAKLRALADPVKRANVARAAAENLRDWHATTDRDWAQWHRERHARAAAKRAEARAAALRAAEEKARWDAMTPFERQLARVAAGARLVPTFRARRADPSMTLGGIASADF